MKASPRLIIPREQDIILNPEQTAELTARLDARNAAIVEHLGKYALNNPDRLIGGSPEIVVPVSEQCQGAVIDVLEVIDGPVPRGKAMDAIEDHWRNGENAVKWPATAYSLTQGVQLSIAMDRLESLGTVRLNYPDYTVELVREPAA